MWAGIRNRLRRRQVGLAGADILAWFRGCALVVRTCGSVIDDPMIGLGEIGSILDRTDRTLFGLSDSAEGIGRSLRKRNPDVANRVKVASRKVIELRNLTARFLIHTQGPTPAFLEGREGAAVRQRRDHYSRALLDYGLAAQALRRDLDGELRELWDSVSALEPDAVAGLPDPLEFPRA